MMFLLLFLLRFQFQKNLRRIVSQLYVRDNCHPFKASLLVWVQLPLWISLSLALRNLSLDQSGKLTLSLGKSATSPGPGLTVNFILCSTTVQSESRGRSVVFWPHLTWLYLDPTCLSGTHQPARGRGQSVQQVCPYSTWWCHPGDALLFFFRCFLCRESTPHVFRGLWQTPSEHSPCWWFPSLLQSHLWVKVHYWSDHIKAAH